MDSSPGKRIRDSSGAGGGESPGGGGDCPECGRHFPSLKALFGHMRSHPDRNWRGINPPPNEVRITADEQLVAASLVSLSQSTPGSNQPSPHSPQPTTGSNEPLLAPEQEVFQCSNCLREFESQQALDGHRASHHNKGCFAATTTELHAEHPPCDAMPLRIRPLPAISEDRREYLLMVSDMMRSEPNRISSEYTCTVCLKGFPTGQALGGHMRWHLERETPQVPSSAANPKYSSRWMLPSGSGISIGSSSRLWGSPGPHIRWPQHSSRQHGVDIGQRHQHPHPPPPPPPPPLPPPPPPLGFGTFHPGWGSPQRFPRRPSSTPPLQRGHGMRGPWNLGDSSSSHAPLRLPGWNIGGSSSFSAVQVPMVHRGLTGSSTSSAVVTTSATGAAIAARGAQAQQAVREPARRRHDREETSSSETDIDLDLRLGR